MTLNVTILDRGLKPTLRSDYVVVKLFRDLLRSLTSCPDDLPALNGALSDVRNFRVGINAHSLLSASIHAALYVRCNFIIKYIELRLQMTKLHDFDLEALKVSIKPVIETHPAYLSLFAEMIQIIDDALHNPSNVESAYYYVSGFVTEFTFSEDVAVQHKVITQLSAFVTWAELQL